MDNANRSFSDLVERSLRTNRRAILIVLAAWLIAAATLIAHALRPGSLLADWPSKAPWLIPMAIVLYVAINGLSRRGRTSAAEANVIETVLQDEFRQVNLARAQRVALLTVLLAQIPLAALSLSGLAMPAAVTVMAVTTVTLGITALIVSFLVFDRE